MSGTLGVKNDVGYQPSTQNLSNVELWLCTIVAVYGYRECVKLWLTKWSMLNIFILEIAGIQVNFVNTSFMDISRQSMENFNPQIH